MRLRTLFTPLVVSVTAFALGCGAESMEIEDGSVPDVDGGAPPVANVDGGAPPIGDDAAVPSSDGGAPVGDGGTTPLPPPPDSIGPAERPARLVVPDAHDGTTALPVVVLLHGYTGSGALQDTYFRLSAATVTEGFYLVIPDGTVDGRGNRFWNASDACCDFGGTGVDDVAYLTGLLDELEGLVPVAAGQTFFIGHSNGGFMSFRMACDLSERVAAIVSLAGAAATDPADCTPTRPVSVLQIHGTADTTVLYDGGRFGASAYPSARESVTRWADRSGCGVATPVEGDAVDIERVLVGDETTVERYTSDCDIGAELWTIQGGSHIPALGASFAPTVLEWMRAHAR